MPVRVIHTKLLFWAALGIFTLGAYSCSEPASPFGQTEITIEALDASCTEVWLDLKFSNLTQPADVAIQKDGKDYHRLLSLNHDTLLVFEDLNPSTNYSFRAIIRHEGKDDRISNTAPVRTMDTTSHSFTWETWTFGGAQSSALYDVAIMSADNICAVGESYELDSLGNFVHQPYNLIHWNGNKWQQKRISQESQCNPVNFPPILAIFKFSEYEYAFTSGGSISWVTGKDTILNECYVRPLIDARLTSIWASSKTNVYAAGQFGNLVHFDGTKWTKIETGTRLSFQDIYGAYNERKGKYEILAITSNLLQNDGKEVFLLEGNSATKLAVNGMTMYFAGLWFAPEKKYFVVGPGVNYKENIYSTENWYVYPQYVLTDGYTHAIRANGLNDIFITSELGELYHFNGISWKKLFNQPGLDFDILYRIAVSEDLIVGVGRIGTKAVIIKGQRNQ